MNNKNDIQPIGLLKNLIVCVYDILLLFSILFFLSFPFVIYFDNQSFGDNIIYRIYLGIISVLEISSKVHLGPQNENLNFSKASIFSFRL